MSDEPFDPLHDDGPTNGDMPAGGLVLIPTPIGNLGDMTLRAIMALKAADTILCEDTRTSARLLAHFGITGRTMALHEHNEDGRIAQVLAMLREGRRVALISDAGTPLVSDPGYRLVRAAVAEGLTVGGVPGANAALLALTLSGLPPHPFLFLGFPPPKSAARRAGFARLRAAEAAGLAATLIWYEAPHRLVETLEDLASVLGPRPAAVARELTKRFEEVRRGSLPELITSFLATPPRGEITIVVGPGGDEAPAADDLDTRLRAALQDHRLKEAVALVTAATGLPRKQVYARALMLESADHIPPG